MFLQYPKKKINKFGLCDQCQFKTELKVKFIDTDENFKSKLSKLVRNSLEEIDIYQYLYRLE